MQTKELILPSSLASVIVNGDLTGLEDNDMLMYEQVLKATEGWSPVDVGEPYFDSIYSPIIGRFNGGVSVYTFLKFGA